VHPTAVSKLNTAAQVTLVVEVLASAICRWSGEGVTSGLSALVLLSTSASAVSYAPAIVTVLRAAEGATAESVSPFRETNPNKPR
jgi:hypothetical protein